MEYKTFNSACIHLAGYDRFTGDMVIQFARSTKTYPFQGVPEEVFDGLCRADSAGEYYNEYIRGNYQVER